MSKPISNHATAQPCQFHQQVPHLWKKNSDELLNCSQAAMHGGLCILHCDKGEGSHWQASMSENLEQEQEFRQALGERMKPVAVDENYFTWRDAAPKQRINLSGVHFPANFSLKDFLAGHDFSMHDKVLLDCRHSHFPEDIDFSHFKWQGGIDFREASIGGDAYFSEASIGGDAYFSEASIGGYADFSEASIGGYADFSEASIGGYADFSEASIGGDAYFSEASIGGDAYFSEASIGGYADFSEASIGGNADFSEASIGGYADFSEASIGGDAYFSEASIGGYADFSEASIGGDADFSEASIGGNADFSEASIGGNAYFSEASIGGDADFSEASIGGDADFSEASIGGDADFSEASIGGDADFSEASIGGYADFSEASIGGYADFSEASIGGYADFSEASIGGNADFSALICLGTLDLSKLRCANFEAVGLNTETLHLHDPEQALRIESSHLLNLAVDCSESGALRLVGCAPDFCLSEAQLKRLEAFQRVFSGNKIAELNALVKDYDSKKDKAKENELATQIKECLTEPVEDTAWKKDKKDKGMWDWLGKAKKRVEAVDVNRLKAIVRWIEGQHTFFERCLELHKEEGTHQQGEAYRGWDFSDQRCDNLAFVECDMRRSNFISSDISGAYFDACEWGNEAEYKSYVHLWQHDEKIKESKKAGLLVQARAQTRAGGELKKLQHTYQRFKKFFEENHDFSLAGQFHFREMQLRELLDPSRINRFLLRTYFRVAHYGENYVRAFLCWLGVVLGFPFLIAFLASATRKKFKWGGFLGDLWDSFGQVLQYFFSAIFPNALNRALGIGADITDMTDKSGNSSTVSMLEKTATHLGINHQWILQGSMVIYYIAFLILSTLFIMALRRAFRRR